MPWTRKLTSSSLSGLLLEHADELGADPLALLLGVAHAAQPGEEPLLGVDRDERHVEVVAERGDHLRALVLSHQAVVDEHAGQTVADRAVHEQRGDARVNPSRQPADRPAVSDLCADAVDLLFDHRAGAPGAVAAADVLEEVGQHLLAVWGVHDLGVELDPVDAARGGLERGHRRRGRRGKRRESRAAARTRCRGATSSRSAPAACPPAAGPARRRSAASARTPPPRRPRPGRRARAPAAACRNRCRAPAPRARAARARARGAPSLVDRSRAARQDHALGPAPGDLLEPRHGAAAAPRTRRIRAPAGRSAASTGRRSRGPRPLRSRRQEPPARSGRPQGLTGWRGQPPSRRQRRQSATPTVADRPPAPMPTPCSRWRCLPSVCSAGATSSSARLNSAMSR